MHATTGTGTLAVNEASDYFRQAAKGPRYPENESFISGLLHLSIPVASSVKGARWSIIMESLLESSQRVTPRVCE